MALSELTDNKRFWVVWNPHGRRPVKKHKTLAIAAAEAQRLATLKPTLHFYVLEATGFAQDDKPAEPPVN